MKANFSFLFTEEIKLATKVRDILLAHVVDLILDVGGLLRLHLLGTAGWSTCMVISSND